ncbi:hypothetical protein HJG60_007732 [Phyllostomus discolor]|uniref:Uncharacterized protein n=1 Tax=Phyllostomus discolor TaxID=89673 RepID=A0A834BKS8_9CHIR|nr:hypothetical protein HJG60_007732 [Phyllostomus discolor]
MSDKPSARRGPHPPRTPPFEMLCWRLLKSERVSLLSRWKPLWPLTLRLCATDPLSFPSKFSVELAHSFTLSFIPWAHSRQGLVMAANPMPGPGNWVLAVAAAAGLQGTLRVLTFPAAASTGLHPSIDHPAPGCRALSGEAPPRTRPFPVSVPSREPQGFNRPPGGFELSCGQLRSLRGCAPKVRVVCWRPLVAKGGRTQWYLRLREAAPQPASLPSR